MIIISHSSKLPPTGVRRPPRWTRSKCEFFHGFDRALEGLVDAAHDVAWTVANTASHLTPFELRHGQELFNGALDLLGRASAEIDACLASKSESPEEAE